MLHRMIERGFVCGMTLGIAIAMILPRDSQGWPQEERVNHDVEVAAIHYPVWTDGQWGYINEKGRMVVEPRFETAGDFFEDRAAVSTKEKSGYIRLDGSWACILPEGAFPVGRFSEGRAWFRLNGRFGAVDVAGRVVIPPIYHQAKEFSNGLAAVMTRLPAKADEADIEFRDPSGFLPDPVPSVERWGFVDREGDVAISLVHSSAGRFGDGLAWIVRPGDTRFEFIDDAGKPRITPNDLVRDSPNFVGSVGEFSEGRVWIAFDGTGPGVPSAIHLDTKGRPVGKRRYDGARSFSEGLAAVRIANKIGYVNHAGEIAIPPRFDDGGDFHSGLCRVQIGRSWKYIDREGTVIAGNAKEDERWNDAEDFFGGLARVHIGGEEQQPVDGRRWWEGGAWYYVDRAGKLVALYIRDKDFARDRRPSNRLDRGVQ